MQHDFHQMQHVHSQMATEIALSSLDYELDYVASASCMILASGVEEFDIACCIDSIFVAMYKACQEARKNT